MNTEANWLHKIVPEMIELVEKRYNILRYVSFVQPIGRRGLAKGIELGERIVRKELDFLRDAGFLTTGPDGMWLTQPGEAVLAQLEALVHKLRGLSMMESQLMMTLKVGRVMIVPGDGDLEPSVKLELGRKAAEVLLAVLPKEGVLAVMGGSTLATVATQIPKNTKWPGTVVPGRGGLGEQVEFQSNWVAAKLAQALGAEHRLLHVPDQLDEAVMEGLLKNPRIGEVQGLLRSANVVMHGIGEAAVMAQRRGLDDRKLEELLDNGAVGESFGYYFNINGDVIDSSPGIGLKLDDLAHVEHILGVAGGNSKAKAILAVCSYQYIDSLVIDEGAAREMLALSRIGT